jgi:hypothetical protein
MRTNIVSPATGLLVFDTETGSFWYYTAAGWQNLSVSSSLADADNDTKIEVEKTISPWLKNISPSIQQIKQM